jgi:hypothetical protein
MARLKRRFWAVGTQRGNPERGLHGRRHLRDSLAQLDPEQHVADDDEGELDHLAVQGELLAVCGHLLPAIEHLAGAARDGRRELHGMIAMEARLDAPSLLTPGVAVGREQALAPVGLDPVEDPALAVVQVVVLQHVLHVVGMVEEEGATRQPQARHVAEPRRIRHELDRVLAPLWDVAEEERPPRRDGRREGAHKEITRTNSPTGDPYWCPRLISLDSTRPHPIIDPATPAPSP